MNRFHANFDSWFLQEFASYAPFEDDDNERKISHEISRRRKKRVPSKAEEPVVEEQPKPVRREKTKKVRKAELPAKSLMEEAIISEETEATVTPDSIESKKRKKKRRRAEISAKVCPVEVCLPEICCADMEGEFLFSTTTRTTLQHSRPPFLHLST